MTTAPTSTATPPLTTADHTSRALRILGSRTGGPGPAETDQASTYALIGLATAVQDLADAVRESA